MSNSVQLLRWNESNLEIVPNAINILRDPLIADKPLVVIAIAGFLREGKSTLMNFFVKFIQKLSRYQQAGNDHTSIPGDWLQENETLEGFSFRSGSQAETMGIWISTPTVIKTPSGDVAVVLADTEGGMDVTSTRNAYKNIFALSTAMSSIQIYNIKGSNLRLDHLEDAAQFSTCGLYASSEGTNQRGLFQRIIFMLRDFQYSSEYGFGIGGGQQLIHQVFNPNNILNPELGKLEQCIRTVFSDGVDCCTLPFPGQSVVFGGALFMGRIGDMDQNFRKEVKTIVEQLLSPSELRPKTLNGQAMTCAEYAHFLEVAAQNCSNQPTIRGVFNTYAELSCTKEVEISTAMYKNEMSTRLPENQLVTNVEQFDSAHKSSLTASCQNYDQATKAFVTLSSKEVKESRFKLKLNIEEIRASLKEIQQGKLEREKRARSDECAQYCTETLLFYDTNMERFCNSQSSVTDTQLYEYHSSTSTQAMQNYDENAAKQPFRDIFSQFRNDLQRSINASYVVHLGRERLRQAAEQERIRNDAEQERLRLKLQAAEQEKLRNAAERERLRQAAEQERIRNDAEQERLRLKLQAAEQEKLRNAAAQERLRRAVERQRLQDAAEQERLQQILHAAEQHPQLVHPQFVHPQFVHPQFLHPQFVHPQFVHPQFLHPQFVHPQFVHPQFVHPQFVHQQFLHPMFHHHHM